MAWPTELNNNTELMNPNRIQFTLHCPNLPTRIPSQLLSSMQLPQPNLIHFCKFTLSLSLALSRARYLSLSHSFHPTPSHSLCSTASKNLMANPLFAEESNPIRVPLVGLWRASYGVVTIKTKLALLCLPTLARSLDLENQVLPSCKF